jgi:DNA-binding Lrp family transcriptional regulator
MLLILVIVKRIVVKIKRKLKMRQIKKKISKCINRVLKSSGNEVISKDHMMEDVLNALLTLDVCRTKQVEELVIEALDKLDTA